MALIGNMSGSLTHLTDGKSYLVAGSGITLTSGSSGNITIASNAGSVAGSDTQFQFNNSDAFGGSDNLTFDGTNITVGAADGDAKLLFRDSAIYLQSSADGQLDIDADGEIEMASAKLDVDMSSDFNISGGAESTITTTAGALNITADANNSAVVIKGDHESGTAIQLDGNAATASVVDIDAGHLDIDASDKVTIDTAKEIELTTADSDGHITIHSAHTSGVAILIDANADAASELDIDAGIVDIDAQGTFAVDATGISLDSDAASNFTTSTGALTLAGVTLDVDATGGAFNIAGTAASTVTTSGGNLALDGQTGVNIQENGTTVIQIDDDGTVDIGPSAASASGNGSDSTFFVSGSFTPAGMGSEIIKARAVFGGDTVISGTIRGGYYAPAQTTMIKLKAGMTTVGAGTVGVTPALGGPGMDVSLFVSGSGNVARSANAPVALFGGRVVTSGSLIPGLDNQIDLGGSSNRWANIYTGDLHLKNDRGDWTVIEENDYLSLRNNKNGKMYKLLMEEITE